MNSERTPGNDVPYIVHSFILFVPTKFQHILTTCVWKSGTYRQIAKNCAPKILCFEMIVCIKIPSQPWLFQLKTFHQKILSLTRIFKFLKSLLTMGKIVNHSSLILWVSPTIKLRLSKLSSEKGSSWVTSHIDLWFSEAENLPRYISCDFRLFSPHE